MSVRKMERKTGEVRQVIIYGVDLTLDKREEGREVIWLEVFCCCHLKYLIQQRSLKSFPRFAVGSLS